ncbi:hypothetical protein [Rathayibacter sp. VKM Ac-2927]|uniref:hypothetical protein n=1 Tax=Rathayibacter sp. VKM Ac-2927 TaxID=2929478 RepID=UPI001FB1A9D5|nr:hypothetical protein [Rathayibacter sp. VKM Ac-2927]MCJ1688985.1 hypothetical protein [Rathayibacter sp. VKM Ac-2927]
MRAHLESAAAHGRAAAALRLASVEVLHTGHRRALASPALAHGTTRDLLERSIRAELAARTGLSERDVARRLEQGELLVEHLPLTRTLLAEARIVWEAAEAICATASKLPAASRGVLDERAAEAVLTMTFEQLNRALRRWQKELR